MCTNFLKKPTWSPAAQTVAQDVIRNTVARGAPLTSLDLKLAVRREGPPGEQISQEQASDCLREWFHHNGGNAVYKVSSNGTYNTYSAIAEQTVAPVPKVEPDLVVSTPAAAMSFRPKPKVSLVRRIARKIRSFLS